MVMCVCVCVFGEDHRVRIKDDLFVCVCVSDKEAHIKNSLKNGSVSEKVFVEIPSDHSVLYGPHRTQCSNIYTCVCVCVGMCF